MTYKLCLRLIELGRMTADKLDVYFAAGRLTSEEYAELIGMFSIATAPEPEEEAEPWPEP